MLIKMQEKVIKFINYILKGKWGNIVLFRVFYNRLWEIKWDYILGRMMYKYYW